MYVGIESGITNIGLPRPGIPGKFTREIYNFRKDSCGMTKNKSNLLPMTQKALSSVAKSFVELLLV